MRVWMWLVNAIRQPIWLAVYHFAVVLNKLTHGRISPNAVTITGVIMHIPIAVLIGLHFWFTAAIFLVIFGLFDNLDGHLARLQNRVSNHGGFLDSTTDRFKEVLIYTGAAFALAAGPHPYMAAWAAAALGASLCVSYVRAKGETIFAVEKRKSYNELNKEFRDGMVSFEVRMFILLWGLVFGVLGPIILVIAILATVTALDRLWSISKVLVVNKN